MGLQRRENDPKRVPSLGISEPISHVTPIKPLDESFIHAGEENEHHETRRGTSSTVRRKESEHGADYFEGHTLRSNPGPVQSSAKSGFGTANATTANKARQKSFNKAENARIANLAPDKVKAHIEDRAEIQKSVDEFRPAWQKKTIQIRSDK